jgi:hypothetical protein
MGKTREGICPEIKGKYPLMGQVPRLGADLIHKRLD